MKNTFRKNKWQSYENPLRPTTFAFSKWNTLHLQAKIKKHGNVSAYLDYLIEKYSYRIYQGYSLTYSFSSSGTRITPRGSMLLKCEIYESTLNELVELARFAAMSKRKMFQILISWDISPPKPCFRMAA